MPGKTVRLTENLWQLTGLGLAATHCVQQLKKSIQVIVPESTPVNVVEKLRDNGADVLVFGKVKI